MQKIKGFEVLFVGDLILTPIRCSDGVHLYYHYVHIVHKYSVWDSCQVVVVWVHLPEVGMDTKESPQFHNEIGLWAQSRDHYFPFPFGHNVRRSIARVKT